MKFILRTRCKNYTDTRAITQRKHTRSALTQAFRRQNLKFSIFSYNLDVVIDAFTMKFGTNLLIFVNVFCLSACAAP